MLVQAEKEICFLHKSCVFKLQKAIDRLSPILIPSQRYLADPPNFSLPSTFKLGKLLGVKTLQGKKTSGVPGHSNCINRLKL
jgi:hypothetical protein